SESKLRTFHDGFRILGLIGRLVAHERPMAFYGIFSAIFMLLALCFGAPVIWHFIQAGNVPKLPSAVLASSLVIVGVLSFMVGLLQSGNLKTRREAMRLAYLRYSSVLPN
ncbi:MAG: glycosyl transferase, partial [Trueperella pyogenes]|nr:glycosyl transferase [Trueperella pyogenes]